MDEADRDATKWPMLLLAAPVIAVMVMLAVVAAIVWYVLSALWGAWELFLNLAKPVGAAPDPALRDPQQWPHLKRFKHGVDQQRKRSQG